MQSLSRARVAAKSLPIAPSAWPRLPRNDGVCVFCQIKSRGSQWSGYATSRTSGKGRLQTQTPPKTATLTPSPVAPEFEYDIVEDEEADVEAARTEAHRQRLQDAIVKAQKELDDIRTAIKDSPAYAGYVAATNWRGLEWVGGETARDAVKDYKGARTITGEGQATAAAYRAIVEVLDAIASGRDASSVIQLPFTSILDKTLLQEVVVTRENGSPAVGLKDRLDFTSSIVEQMRALKLGAEISKEAEATIKHTVNTVAGQWQEISLAEDTLKLAFVKRLSQLLGRRISDFDVSESATVGDLVSRIAIAPPKAKLYDILADVEAFAKPFERADTLAETPAGAVRLLDLPNVSVLPLRQSKVTQEVKTGRWKIMERELASRGLPIFGKDPYRNGYFEKAHPDAARPHGGYRRRRQPRKGKYYDQEALYPSLADEEVELKGGNIERFLTSPSFQWASLAISKGSKRGLDIQTTWCHFDFSTAPLPDSLRKHAHGKLQARHGAHGVSLASSATRPWATGAAGAGNIGPALRGSRLRHGRTGTAARRRARVYACYFDSTDPVAGFYADTHSFACLSVPSISIKASAVNDDYCDCPDGSDEPGTSACAHLSPLSPETHPHPNATDNDQLSVQVSAALPGFWCENKGHIGGYVPFTHVNDGICDDALCCDGSDEWARPTGKACPNRCKEIGREWRAAEAERRTAATAALARKEELIKAAAIKRKELEDQVKNLVIQVEASEVKVKQLEKDEADIEARERNRLVKSGGPGKAGVLAGLAKERLQRLRQVLQFVKLEKDGYATRLAELEALLKTFKVEYNPNFNDEGVKRAVRAWDEYAAKGHASLTHDEEDDGEDDEDPIVIDALSDKNDGIDWEEFESGDTETEEVSDVAALYNLAAYLPPSFREWLNEQFANLRKVLEDNGVLPKQTPSSSTGGKDSKAVREAKARTSAAKTTLNQQRSDKTKREDELKGDFGPQDVWRSLKGTCSSVDSGEYEYEVCWLDQVTQKSKKGGGGQNMGKFSGFGTEFVEDGDGPQQLGTGWRTTLQYTGGSHCWNGPARSTTVVLACSASEAVWRVSELEKCVYRVEAGSAAVCGGGPPGAGAGSDPAPRARDEL